MTHAISSVTGPIADAVSIVSPLAGLAGKRNTAELQDNVGDDLLSIGQDVLSIGAAIAPLAVLVGKRDADVQVGNLDQSVTTGHHSFDFQVFKVAG